MKKCLFTCINFRIAFIVLLYISNATTLSAQEGTGRTNKLGGHFGIVHPLVIFSGGKTTTIANSYNVGFPTGVTIKTSTKFAFDIEFVPFINEGNRVNLLFHPGALFPLGKNFTFGTRAAFEINQGAYGFTPLLNKAFPMKNNTAVFAELVLPVRFDGFGNMATIIALHIGIGF